MEHKEREMNMQATSVRPEGINKEWELIWDSSAPPKVKTFTWKLARNGLPTQQNFRKRKMDTLGICTVCGTEEEDTFHALITCPPARNLWNKMRECWDLPNEKLLEHTGRDWVLPLLAKLNNIQRLMVMMVLWRVWHVHNELTHNKPAPPTEVSKRFLCSYVDTLLFLKQHPHADPCKGKQVVSYSGRYLREPLQQEKVEVKQWVRPPRGRLKLNVDGSYVMQTREGGVGMILRDEEGAVVFAACRYMPSCTSALEAELAACDEGMRLALCWANKPFDLETDCLTAANEIREPGQSGSILVHLVRSIHEAVSERKVDVRHIDRSQNGASHTLAKIGRESKRTQLWLSSLPEEVEEIIRMDCNVTLS
jgi:ribonuclease HI